MKLENKLKRADGLRKELKSAARDIDDLYANYRKTFSKARTERDRKEVDLNFQKQFSVLDKKEDKAYTKYNNFIIKNFKSDVVSNCAAGGVYQEKEFINRLRREMTRRKK